jgi:hypothetical protein
MADFPHPMLASYWVPAVDCASQSVAVPLTDILKYRLKNQSPQNAVVFLAFGRFFLKPSEFKPACVKIDQAILDQIATVRKLQSAGIKVLLSIVGDHTGLGWDTIPYAQGSKPYANMEAFAQWVRTHLVDAYGLDGIDIDDEFRNPGTKEYPRNGQQFMDTVGILRHFMDGKLLTKALWWDDEYFKIAVSGDAPYNGGAKLGRLLDLGCTMGYGWGFGEQISELEKYRDAYQMGYQKVCIGVQAGDWSWTTPLDRVQQLAQWVGGPSNTRANGMMLWTFTQDIPKCTGKDHAWQKTMVEGMWGWKILDE